MIREGLAIQDLRAMAKENLLQKGTAFDLVEIEADLTYMQVLANACMPCLRLGATGIFWYDPPNYEVMKEIVRGAGMIIDADPSIFSFGTKRGIVTYHTSYRPFIVGCNDRTNNGKIRVKRGNVFHYPNGDPKPSKAAMVDILHTFLGKYESARVLIPNAVRSSTVLACKELGYDHLAWGSAQVKIETEQHWNADVERRLEVARRRGA